MRLPLLQTGSPEPWTWLPTTIRALSKNEEYLESLIGKAPELLGLEDYRTHVKGPYAAFHQLGVETPSGQMVAPDILFLTASGHVVVVEVKLADNEELRGRKAVAQVVEYAASIATYSEQELVELFDRDLPDGSRFSDVVRKHLSTCAAPVELAAELVRKIQAAEIHLVVACDQAPEGLRELVASVTAQQSLGNYELRVCELLPYVGPEGAAGGIFLVPGGVMRTEVVGRTEVRVTTDADGQRMLSARTTSLDDVEDAIAVASGKVLRETQPQIAGAICAYAQMCEPGTALTGRAPTYRYVVVEGWPAVLHYEFLHRKTRNEFGAELHFESNEETVQAAARAVRDAGLQATPELPGLTWDQGWGNGKGRLRVLFTSDTDPAVVSRAMVALIRKTRAIVDKALRE